MEIKVQVPEWWKALKFAHDPIVIYDDGWYFYDETWVNLHGPFATRDEAIFLLGRYCAELDITYKM